MILVHGIRTNGHTTWRDADRVLSAAGFDCRLLRYREFHGPLAFLRVLCWPWALAAALVPLLLLTGNDWVVAIAAISCYLTAACVGSCEEFDWNLPPDGGPPARTLFRTQLRSLSISAVWLGLVALLVVLFVVSVCWISGEVKRVLWPVGLFFGAWVLFVRAIWHSEFSTWVWWDGQLPRERQPHFPRPVRWMLFLTLVVPLILVPSCLLGWLPAGGWVWWLGVVGYAVVLLISGAVEASLRRSSAVDRFLQRYPECSQIALENNQPRPIHAVIAHSMGTVVSIGGLLRSFDMGPLAAFVILAGSPLPRRYDWSPLFDTGRRLGAARHRRERVHQLRNEVGGHDWIVWLTSVNLYPRELGGAGISGFLDPGFHTVQTSHASCDRCTDCCTAVAQNVVRPNAEHSSVFLTSRSVIHTWLPFLSGHDVDLFSAFVDACVELVGRSRFSQDLERCLDNLAEVEVHTLRQPMGQELGDDIDALCRTQWRFASPKSPLVPISSTIASQVRFALSQTRPGGNGHSALSAARSLAVRRAVGMVTAVSVRRAYRSLQNASAQPDLACNRNVDPVYAVESAIQYVFARAGLPL